MPLILVHIYRAPRLSVISIINSEKIIIDGNENISKQKIK